MDMNASWDALKNGNQKELWWIDLFLIDQLSDLYDLWGDYSGKAWFKLFFALCKMIRYQQFADCFVPLTSEHVNTGLERIVKENVYLSNNQFTVPYIEIADLAFYHVYSFYLNTEYCTRAICPRDLQSIVSIKSVKHNR